MILSPSPFLKFFDNNGVPLAGGKLFTYVAGTATKQATYTDSTGGVQNANPIILDARGECNCWLQTGLFYKFVLAPANDTDPPSSPIKTTDNITISTDSTQIIYAQTPAEQAAGVTPVNYYYKPGRPERYGGDPTGTNDSSSAWTQAAAGNTYVDATLASWKISSSVSIPAAREIDLRGSNVVLNCGSSPGFQFLNGNAGLTIRHSGGTITGTASCFLFAQGTTNTPSSQANYASQIHLNGLWISSTTITTALLFDKAVKSVYIDGANFFTPNGINASGKCVEVMISDSLIYGATGVAGTAGIKLRSTGGTTYYNEGWSVVNSTIDNFEIGHDITDVFVYQIVGGYNGCALVGSTGYVLQAQAPSTNLCEEITVGGQTVLAGRVRFASSAGGQAYNARFDTFTTINTPGTAFAIENNAAQISICNGKFKGGSSTAIGVVGSNNNAGIVCSNLDFDSTYTNGVVLNGANGAGCRVGPLTGPVSGDMYGSGRSNVLLIGVPANTANVATFKQTFNPSDLAGTVTVGNNLASITVSCAKGECGVIKIGLPCSGMNAGTQLFLVSVPAGMVIPSGTGWNAAFTYPSAASEFVSRDIPYFCTADINAQTLSIQNNAGNSVTLNSHGYFGIVRDW